MLKKKKGTSYWYNNLDRPQGHYAEWKKKPIRKSHIQYDSIYIMSSKWQNCRDREQVARVREGEGILKKPGDERQN